MSNEEAKRLVADGLQLRRQRREEAERETRLEKYERDMIAGCNGNCAAARKSRNMDAERTMTLVQEAASRQERQAQLAAQRKQEREEMLQQWAREETACEAVKRYVFGCMGLMLLTVWTPLPWWAAAALIAGTAVCLGAYVFRIYYPAEDTEEENGRTVREAGPYGKTG